MDPNTGAIKAMVTDTDYDLNNPNDLSSFYTDEELATFADNEVKSEEYEKYLEKEQEKLKEQMCIRDRHWTDSGLQHRATCVS